MIDDTLTRAAELLRQRAEEATTGEWVARDYADDEAAVHTTPAGLVATCGDREHPTARGDATYIATMQPRVALAMAVWLERQHVRATLHRYVEHEVYDVARAVLGEVTP